MDIRTHIHTQVSSIFGDRMGDSYTPLRADVGLAHIPSGSASNETGARPPIPHTQGTYGSRLVYICVCVYKYTYIGSNKRRRRFSSINNKFETKSLPHMKLLRQWLLDLASATLAVPKP